MSLNPGNLCFKTTKTGHSGCVLLLRDIKYVGIYFCLLDNHLCHFSPYSTSLPLQLPFLNHSSYRVTQWLLRECNGIKISYEIEHEVWEVEDDRRPLEFERRGERGYMWVCECCNEPYLQSYITELSTLSQSVHLGHSGIQEALIFKDQITIWNHLGWILIESLKRIGDKKVYAMAANITLHASVFSLWWLYFQLCSTMQSSWFY